MPSRRLGNLSDRSLGVAVLCADALLLRFSETNLGAKCYFIFYLVGVYVGRIK